MKSFTTIALILSFFVCSQLSASIGQQPPPPTVEEIYVETHFEIWDRKDPDLCPFKPGVRIHIQVVPKKDIYKGLTPEEKKEVLDYKERLLEAGVPGQIAEELELKKIENIKTRKRLKKPEA